MSKGHSGPRLQPEAVSPPRFSKDDPSAMEYLKREGYVVIKEVISNEEIQEGLELMWKFLQNYSSNKINRNEISTWSEWPKTFPSGIIKGDGIGQSEFMWYLREKQNIREIFWPRSGKAKKKKNQLLNY